VNLDFFIVFKVIVFFLNAIARTRPHNLVETIILNGYISGELTPPLPGTSLLTIDRSLTETDLSTGTTTTTGTGTTGTTGGLLATFLSKLRFEITDHLGNVRAVVTGQKKADNSATIVALTDYHEFGSPMGDRSYTLEAYRYGYQGSENDKELWGGAGINTEFRMLDPRIGRWFMADPITQPYQSPYTSMDNDPVNLIDPLGLSSVKGNGTYRSGHRPQLVDANPVQSFTGSNASQIGGQMAMSAVNMTMNNMSQNALASQPISMVSIKMMNEGPAFMKWLGFNSINDRFESLAECLLVWLD
jgi:RHS repeat-associated protein